MPNSLVTRLETDAKLIRMLLLVRASLWTSHGAVAKLAGGEADATLLAGAGLDRLGRSEIGHPIPIEEMLPAGLPVSGLRIGEVEIRSSGPATSGERTTG